MFSSFNIQTPNFYILTFLNANIVNFLFYTELNFFFAKKIYQRENKNSKDSMMKRTVTESRNFRRSVTKSFNFINTSDIIFLTVISQYITITNILHQYFKKCHELNSVMVFSINSKCY
jgi:hypothetical protein